MQKAVLTFKKFHYSTETMSRVNYRGNKCLFEITGSWFAKNEKKLEILFIICFQTKTWSVSAPMETQRTNAAYTTLSNYFGMMNPFNSFG